MSRAVGLSRFIVLATVASTLAVGSLATSAQQKKYKATVLQQVDLGDVPKGKQVLKVTLLEMQPGAEIQSHTHRGPGIRYVLDGAISIAWKDRGTQIFRAGSTYYEGAGDNHPPAQMSAKNAAEVVTRVLIFELLPSE